MSKPLLAAVLIVRDEASALPDCLASLDGVADEVYVHDTGSSDETVAVASAYGAIVGHGTWNDSFAEARNAAADGCAASWVLALDADHRVRADPDTLRMFLRGLSAGTGALRVEVDDAHHAEPYRQFETRLYRPGAASWTGRVHERLVPSPARETVPASVMSLRHLGHATHPDRVRRASRDIELGLLELASADPAEDRERIAHTLLGLGRDCAAAERWQQAADTFEELRELFPGTPEWIQATDALARLVLAAGHDEICLVLVDQLRAAGASTMYCDWLAAQALAQLGDVEAASMLLSGVYEVVDTAGRRRPPEARREVSMLVERLRALR